MYGLSEKKLDEIAGGILYGLEAAAQPHPHLTHALAAVDKPSRIGRYLFPGEQPPPKAGYTPSAAVLKTKLEPARTQSAVAQPPVPSATVVAAPERAASTHVVQSDSRKRARTDEPQGSPRFVASQPVYSSPLSSPPSPFIDAHVKRPWLPVTSLSASRQQTAQLQRAADSKTAAEAHTQANATDGESKLNQPTSHVVVKQSPTQSPSAARSRSRSHSRSDGTGGAGHQSDKENARAMVNSHESASTNEVGGEKNEPEDMIGSVTLSSCLVNG